MNTQIPYSIVLFPRVDSSQIAQIESFRLATELSRIAESRTHTFEVFDFEVSYAKFILEDTFLPEEKNEIFFIEQFKNIIFKPGVVTFVYNLDMGDIFILVNSCQANSPNSKVFLIITKSQFDDWNLMERPQCVDCCIHTGSTNKSMMDKLGMIRKSHLIEC